MSNRSTSELDFTFTNSATIPDCSIQYSSSSSLKSVVIAITNSATIPDCSIQYSSSSSLKSVVIAIYYNIVGDIRSFLIYRLLRWCEAILRIMEFAPELLASVSAPDLDLPWEEDVVALRREFHAHPELGYQETRTSQIVAQRLRALGYEVEERVGVTGVVGVLRGDRSGPCVLVRADMDALPVEENTPWQWKSENAGVMHACGHDCHMAIGLTVARLLAQRDQPLRGTVKFMFQPAEEGLGGAARMMEAGALENPRPDFALALHVWSEIEAGTIGLSSGPVMAAADEFRARINGKGGHGAMPHQTTDAIMVAAQVVGALQTIVARNVKPLDAGVVTVGSLHSGSAFNVIPGEAIMEGTLRSFDPRVRQTLRDRARMIVEELPRAFGASGEWQLVPGYPATVNDPAIIDRLRPIFESVAGRENVQPFEPTMGAEDMSLVLQQIPGCYFFVGGRSEASGAIWPHHHPRFNIDESALLLGARAMTAAVEELLQS